MRLILIIIALFSVLVIQTTNAQSNDSTTITFDLPVNWFNLDPEEDSILGVSTEKAYRIILKNKTSRSVVVAVIDSGVDINHEDLQGSIWTNIDEIIGNGIDDDNNGYIDDINGWNFIGNPSGENIESDSYELTREYTRLMKLFEGEDSLKMRKKNKDLYTNFKKLEKQFHKQKVKVESEYQQFSTFYRNYKFTKEILLNFTKSDTITREVLEKIDSNANDQILQLRAFYFNLLENNVSEKELTKWKEHLEKQLNFAYNPAFDPRDLVGDDYEDMDEKYYGNNDVMGPDAIHGTHVAGIIAATRKNNLGINGVADNVKIMAIRAVPDGDERDKDIANSIYYAVDNGAQIINMSFGKSYSPQKNVVDKAVRYAENKGVLIIHAAGNSAKNIDVKNNFPTQTYLNDKGASKLWIEVGASDTGQNNNFVGNFSNYGKETVNIFAPGCEIRSTTPNNSYKNLDGTSMASPVTAGVAALLFSYYPNLTAQQIKDILIKSAIKYANLEVTKPSTDKENHEKIKFSELSTSGAIVNAYEAVKIAESMKIDADN